MLWKTLYYIWFSRSPGSVVLMVVSGILCCLCMERIMDKSLCNGKLWSSSLASSLLYASLYAYYLQSFGEWRCPQSMTCRMHACLLRLLNLLPFAPPPIDLAPPSPPPSAPPPECLTDATRAIKNPAPCTARRRAPPQRHQWRQRVRRRRHGHCRALAPLPGHRAVQAAR